MALVSKPLSRTSTYQSTKLNELSSSEIFYWFISFSINAMGSLYYSSYYSISRTSSCALKSAIENFYSSVILNLRCSFNFGIKQSKSSNGDLSSRACSASQTGVFSDTIFSKVQDFFIASSASLSFAVVLSLYERNYLHIQ